MMPGSPFPHHEESLRCEVVRGDDTATVRPVGALDIATVPVLDEQLAELRDAGFHRLVLDLRGLRFMDSTGMRCVLKYDAEARNDGFSIELIRGQPAVQRVFELTGTDEHLPFVDAGP